MQRLLLSYRVGRARLARYWRAFDELCSRPLHAYLHASKAILALQLSPSTSSPGSNKCGLKK